PYRWASDDPDLMANDYSNVRAVKWLKTVPRIAFSEAALHSFGSFSSVSTSDEHLDEVITVLTKEPGVEGPSITGPVVPAKSTGGLSKPSDAALTPEQAATVEAET